MLDNSETLGSGYDGLTREELEAVRERYGALRTVEDTTETGAAYAVVFMGLDENGPITRTVCRERGVVAVLDEKGAVVAEGQGVEEVLAA